MSSTLFMPMNVIEKEKLGPQNGYFLRRVEAFGLGLVTLVHENFNPVLIPMKNEPKISKNIVVVEAIIRKVKVRFISIWGTGNIFIRRKM